MKTKKDQLYYTIKHTNTGYTELHVSIDKEEVTELTCLSKKIPTGSKWEKDFVKACHTEMKIYKAKEIKS